MVFLELIGIGSDRGSYWIGLLYFYINNSKDVKFEVINADS